MHSGAITLVSSMSFPVLYKYKNKVIYVRMCVRSTKLKNKFKLKTVKISIATIVVARDNIQFNIIWFSNTH